MIKRQHDCLGHVLLAVLGFLGRGAHGVVAEHGEEHRGRTGHDRAEAAGHERVVVVGVDVEDAQADDEQDQDHLDGHRHQFEAAERLGSTGQDPGDQQADQDGRQVDDAAFSFVRRGGHPRRHVDADAGKESVEVAGNADRDDGDDCDVLQQEVPADEPSDDLAKGNIAIGIGGSGAGDHAGEFRIGKCRGR